MNPDLPPAPSPPLPTDGEIAAWVAAAAPVLGIDLDEARAARVAGHLGRSWAIAQRLVAEPLALELDPAEVYRAAPFAATAAPRQSTEAIAAAPLPAKPAMSVAQAQARIAERDPNINAFTHHFPNRRRQTASQPNPWLDGVPFAVKNLFDVAGVPTVAGSRVLNDAPPAAEDAVAIQRLEAAGAVLVGTLNMDEFAYGFTTENTHYGPTRNPHDPARISGGSSGGSGAAVAAGMVPLSLGSDTNGSIRVPASLCGVWGMKPTFGRLSRRGAFPFVHSLDHIGPMADCIERLAAAYDAMQGPDALDPSCAATQVEPAFPTLAQGVAGLRVGVLTGYFETFADAAALEAVATAARALGASQAVVWPDAPVARSAAFVLTASEGASLHMPRLRAGAAMLQALEPLSVDRFIAGALQPADWALRAQRFRRLYRDRVQALWRDWDVLIAPATPCVAPAIGTEWLEIGGARMPARAAMGLLAQPISFAGCPVVVAPMWPQHAAAQGMPLGVQLIAPAWREDWALRAGYALAKASVAHTQKVRA
jgi:1-carboxybiuret hydrolase